MARRRLVGHRDAGDEAAEEGSARGLADPCASVGVCVCVGGCPGRVKARKLGARLWRLQVSKRCGFDPVSKAFAWE